MYPDRITKRAASGLLQFSVRDDLHILHRISEARLIN